MKKSILLLVVLLAFMGNCTKVKKGIIPMFGQQAPSEESGLTPSGSAAAFGKIASISVTPPTATIAKTTKGAYKAIAIDESGNKIDITSSADWSVTPTTISSIAAKGVISGVAAGDAKVTASYSSLTGNAKVKVTDATLTAIQIDPAGDMDVGTTSSLKAVGVFSDGTTQDLTDFVDWSSSGDAAAVSKDNGSKGKVTGKSAGAATITASLNGVSGTSNVTIADKTLVGISIDADTTIVKGSQKYYKATAIYSDESTQDITDVVTWSSSDTTIARLSTLTTTKGIVDGLAAGAATISATWDGKTGTSKLTVTAPKLVSVTVEAVGGNSIANGASKQFKATAIFDDGSSIDATNLVSWSSSDLEKFALGNGDYQSGLGYALGEGSVTVKATLNGISGSAAVTISSATLTSITINGPSTLNKGAVQPYTATGIYSDGSIQDVTKLVTWSSKDTTKAYISNTVGSNGKLTALTAGSSDISVSLGDGASKITASLTLTIGEATITSISVSPANPTKAKGLTQNLVATAIYSDNSTQNVTSLVTWSSSDAAKVDVNNASNTKGLATALDVGSSTITAKLGGISGSTTFTVTAATIKSIVVDVIGGSTLAKGSTKQLSAIAIMTDGTSQDVTNLVTWSSSDNAIALAGNSSGSKGLISGVAAGSSTITASLNGVSGKANMTISAPTLTSITVTPATGSLAKGLTQQFVATANFSDGSTQNITNLATWKSDSNADGVNDTSVASISNAIGSNGLATGMGAGSTKISATWNGITSSVDFTVSAATIASISVIPSNVTRSKGLTQQYTATAILSDGTSQDVTNLVTWKSDSDNDGNDDTKVASISNAAGSKGSSIANAEGNTQIIATLSGKSGSTKLTVSAATLVSISVTSSGTISNIAKGTTQQLTAIGTYSDGSTKNITEDVVWSTSDATKVSVINTSGSKGLVRGEDVGASTITASLGGINGTVDATGSSATIASIAVTPNAATGAKGTSQQFTATATMSDGTTQNVTSSVVWKSDSDNDGNDDSKVVSISNVSGSKGLGTNVAAGSAKITASIGGVTGTANYTVSSATIASISISPSNTTILNGSSVNFIATANLSDSTTQDITNLVTWKADSNKDGLDDSTVASISNAAESKGKATGNAKGETKITATYNGITSGAVSLQVTSGALQSIAITPSAATITSGSTLPFTAIGTYADGSKGVITGEVTWKSDSNADGNDDSLIAGISNSSTTKGVVTAAALGTTKITASLDGKTSNESILTVAANASITLGGSNINLPTGLNVGGTPAGDFTGSTYNNGTPATGVAGFISEIPTGTATNCSTLGANIISSINADTGTGKFFASYSQVNSSTVGTAPNCSIIYSLSSTTSSAKTVTEVSNELIEKIGLNSATGTVTALPTNMAGETTSTTFRLTIQATYSDSKAETVGVGVTSEANYSTNEALLTNFLNGTNMTSTSATIASKTDNFTGQADPQVDFVWVVDNSGSMEDEQTAVNNAATTFFSKLGNKHLDYRLGVITTDSNTMRTVAGTAWTTAADGSTKFTQNIAAGTSGNGKESGIWFAEKSIGGPDGSGAKTVVKRASAKLVFVILSDEGDQYECWANSGVSDNGTADPCSASTRANKFNTSSNIFVTNSYKVNTITGLASAGVAGKCSGNGTSADTLNNEWPAYVNLATATGGASASICSASFDTIMDNIATQAAGSAAPYVLTKQAIASTIVVKVNGTVVPQSSSNGWTYNSSSKTIVFSGTAWPAQGAAIEVTYNYDTSVAFVDPSTSTLLASVSHIGNNNTTRASIFIALVVSTILLGKLWFTRR